MKVRARLFTTLVLVSMTGVTGYAQPDPNRVPKAANPQNRERQGRDREGRNRQGRQRPEQTERETTRARRMRERRMEVISRLLKAQGFTDKKLQDAIADFQTELDKAREPLRQATLKLRPALRKQVMTETQVGIIVNDYQAAVEDYEERRRQAEAKLDQQIGYRKKPRLHAVLILGGVFNTTNVQPR